MIVVSTDVVRGEKDSADVCNPIARMLSVMMVLLILNWSLSMASKCCNRSSNTVTGLMELFNAT